MIPNLFREIYLKFLNIEVTLWLMNYLYKNCYIKYNYYNKVIFNIQ